MIFRSVPIIFLMPPVKRQVTCMIFRIIFIMMLMHKLARHKHDGVIILIMLER